ncbi:hypothetical protein [Oceanimonas baumannii]|uniref:Uncharacterized protein n=1 Tax=Oceanimonas baumannii TaxID=129578 RepID=A0A235CMR6_9GAMM|nr:hypothetical protein [Oceanimonas baumannii]OYD25729.1 hypothetical protein B6S09_02490 [Oceanimonas baumannii]TDW60267.1 hypothetical protein LY04_01263 [Oceanimonas baumannii]
MKTQISALGLAFTLLCAPAMADLTIESKIPGSAEGTVKYASMDFWLETDNGDTIDLADTDEVYDYLIDKVGQKVRFDGASVTYSNGHTYFEPKFEQAAALPALKVSLSTNDDGVTHIFLDDRPAFSVNDYYSARVLKEYTTSDNKVSVIQLLTGGTGCPADHMLLVSHYHGQPLLTPTFGNCSDMIETKVENGKIVMELPGKVDETWTWDNATYRLVKQG